MATKEIRKCLVCEWSLISFKEKEFCSECTIAIQEHFAKNPKKWNNKGFAIPIGYMDTDSYTDGEGILIKIKHKPVLGYQLNVRSVYIFLKKQNKGDEIAKQLLEI